MFQTYFELGFFHVTDLNGYDHIVFLIALMAAFLPSQFKEIIWLVTAFTVGHCITLLLAALGVFVVEPAISEKLIPITILLTAISNLFAHKRPLSFLVGITLLFGLVHGLAFSNYFKTILMEESIVGPLFSFNVGVEVGQLLIVGIGLLLNALFVKGFGLAFSTWRIGLSILAILLSLQMLFL